MSIEITHIRLSGMYEGHEYITHYKWRSDSGDVGSSDKSTMVDWIDVKKGMAYVGSGAQRARVGVVRPAQGLPYLRTYADGQWTNNLLSLPRF
ncbi:DUF3892 domain-containing protein [Kocuria sp. CPCC 205261]|uniref:DUF3892 domain-containing protein n=1 Tax=Kocuria sp. CPCC 205261 TaxID=3073554 RepID=UPI0034D3F850